LEKRTIFSALFSDPADPCDPSFLTLACILSAGDTDGDGIADTTETGNGTDETDSCDPNPDSADCLGIVTADTDGDGIADTTETGNGTDVNDPCDPEPFSEQCLVNPGDIDGDGFSDNAETEVLLSNQFNPCDPQPLKEGCIGFPSDIDGDGFSNNAENIVLLSNQFNPCDPQPLKEGCIGFPSDTDGDGFSNNAENIVLLSDPTDPCDPEPLAIECAIDIDVDATLTKTCTPDSQFEPGTIDWEWVITNTSPDGVSSLSVSCDGFSTINDPEVEDEIVTVLTFGGAATNMWTESGLLAGSYSNEITCTFTDPVGGTFQRTASAECEVEAPIQVDVDIKPGSDPNSINPRSMGKVPVAILGSDSFDVTQVDVTTLAFGPNGATPAHDLTDPDTLAGHIEDVNDDGFLDLVSHYNQKQTGLACGDTDATLTGALLDGTPFDGTDSVRMVPCR